MASSIKRTTVNFILTLSGGLITSSGFFLLFHIKTPLIAMTHEIGSMVFVTACVFHLALNWKPLLHTLKGKVPISAILAIMLMFTLAMGYTTTLPDTRSGRGKRHSSVEESNRKIESASIGVAQHISISQASGNACS